MWPYLAVGPLQMSLVKMRSSWRRVSPSHRMGVAIKRESLFPDFLYHRQCTQGECHVKMASGGRLYPLRSTSDGQRTARSEDAGTEHFLPHGPDGTNPPTPSAWTSSLHQPTRAHFCCSHHPVRGSSYAALGSDCPDVTRTGRTH